MAWEALDRYEKDEFLALLPDRQYIVDANTDDARPDFVGLVNDDTFRVDCTAYQQNVTASRHTAQWLTDAWKAHESRKAGEFDGHLDAKFEAEWGVELPEKLKRKRQS